MAELIDVKKLDTKDDPPPYELESKNAFQNGDTVQEEIPDKSEDDPTENMTPEEKRKASRKIMKNILLISVAFLCTFTAYNGLAKLQSSLHLDQGMGVINQSILYAALVVSCLFVPKLVIAQFGHKWTLVVSTIGYILWMAANGYAVWGTMVTASIIVGICAAPLWTAQGSYLTLSSIRYAQLKKENQQAVVTRFFGIFYMFFQASNIVGNIIAATVLQTTPVNATDPPDSVLENCGANDCPWVKSNNTNLKPPDKNVVWLLVGIYIGITAIAIIVMSLFLDNVPKDLAEKPKNLKKEIVQIMLATVKHLKYKKQIFIIPHTVYSGFHQGFFTADWTKSYISCSMGIWTVGLALLPFGVVNAIVSYCSGRLAKITGRMPLFIAAFILDLAIQITMFIWKPNPKQAAVFFVISGLWGITDGIWQTQRTSLYGSLFSEESEAAFSNYRMWESFGFIIAFAYSNYLCTYVKLAVLMGMLFISMIGYFIVEYIQWKEVKIKPFQAKQLN